MATAIQLKPVRKNQKHIELNQENKTDVITILDERIKSQISKEYLDIQTNIEDVSNLTERRKQHIVRLGRLYEKRIELGTLKNDKGETLKIHEIARQVYKDLAENSIPIASYRTVIRYMPKKYQRPYHFTRIKDDIDEEGNPTGNNAEVTTIVNPSKFTMSTEKVNLPNLDDLSQDGTPHIVSQATFDNLKENIDELVKASKNIDGLSPAQISALAVNLEEVQDSMDKYIDFYDIKVPGRVKKNNSSVSLNLKKPPYRDNMVADEWALFIKDCIVIKKQLNHMIFSKEEALHYWESVRKQRLKVRPWVNEKWKRNWDSYCKIMQLLQHKNISGVARRDTLSKAEIYDPETDKMVPLQELEDEMNKNPDSITLKNRMKGISRFHLRNMNEKLLDIFAAFIVEEPFFADFCNLFKEKLEPLRNAKACMIADRQTGIPGIKQ